jgi:ATP-dependent RNA helicase DHX29
VEADRRFSKSLPLLALSPSLTEHIISLALESDAAEGTVAQNDQWRCSQFSFTEKKFIHESDEKSALRLGITYGVLRRLGFSETRVEDCLRAMQGVDVDEAYEWVK